jgi:ABC-2 type transport system permease protein
MRQMFALAMKDLKILFRVKPALFFTVGWPLTIAILFGSIFGGGGGGRPNKLPIAVVDEDRSAQSQAFVRQLASRDSLDVMDVSREEAAQLVRRGKRSAAVILPAGFGMARQRLFYGAPPAIELLTDPSHKMEAGMLEGMLYEQSAQAMQALLTRLVASGGGTGGSTNGASSAAPNAATAWKPVEITVREVGSEDRGGPRSGFEVSFVQGLVWAIFGCVMGFSMSLVTERTQGTFTRLRMAPLTDMQVLGGKALGCFLMLLLMQSVLLALGVFGFGVRIASPALLAVAILCSSLAFVGLMMLVASLGRTEEGTRGAGFATLMPMSLFGGGMIPLFIMPAWMVTLSNFSPVKWAVLAVEGAMWRGFALRDMLLPCGILLAVGGLSFVLGTRSLKRIGFGA